MQAAAWSVQSQLSAKLWFHAAFKPSGKQSTRVYHFTKALKDVTSLKQNILSHHHIIVRLQWWWRCCTTIPQQRVVTHRPRAPLSSGDKEPDKSAAWGDLFTHRYQQSAEQRVTAAITMYRCGPAASRVLRAASPAARLIHSQTASATFDVCFLLPEALSFPLVDDCFGSKYRYLYEAVKSPFT